MKSCVTLMSTAAVMCGALAVAEAQSRPPATPKAAEPKTTAQAPAPSSNPDHVFLQQMAMGNLAEVQLGEIATKKTGNAAVKTFAQRMVADHGKASAEVKSLAASKQVAIPSNVGSEHKATIDRLSKLSGAEFDRAYASNMVEKHQKTLDTLKHQSMSGKDEQVKAWAAKTAPTVEQHLKMARDLEREVSGVRANPSR
jgi:putative membrane protein